MRPPKREKTDYEKVKIDTWIPGIIEEIKYEEKHESTFKGEKKVYPAIRFKFKLDEYEYPHYSGWMYFGYGATTSLYLKFLSQLVENAQPDMDFDLDNLLGFGIKTMWVEKGDYQNLGMIRPMISKYKDTSSAATPIKNDVAETHEDENMDDGVPF